MTDKTPRRFTLFDGMVLIAATAVGIAWTQVILNDIGNYDISFRTIEGSLRNLMALAMIVNPIVLAWTVALLLLRLLPPRPKRRHLTRQPGLIACLIVTITTLLATAFLWIASLELSYWSSPRHKLGDFVPDSHELLLVIAPVTQAGLMCSWVTLALTGRWRSERSWIDRAGRLIGVVWLTELPFISLFWMIELID